MVETYYIGAYWKARKESLEECAQRAAGFLRCLAPCDPCFDQWYSTGEVGVNDVTFSNEHLRQLLLAGRNRSDIGNEVIEDLGYRVILMNGGNREERAILTMHCGSYAMLPGYSNSCVISPPYQGTVGERLLQVAVMIEAMRCIASQWEPEWGVVNSHVYRQLSSHPLGIAGRVGWITYLAHSQKMIPALPHPTRTIAVGESGTLIVAMDERFSMASPEHVGLVDQVATILAQSGVIQPTI